jgi:hypothetical protein
VGHQRVSYLDDRLPTRAASSSRYGSGRAEPPLRRDPPDRDELGSTKNGRAAAQLRDRPRNQRSRWPGCHLGLALLDAATRTCRRPPRRRQHTPARGQRVPVRAPRGVGRYRAGRRPDVISSSEPSRRPRAALSQRRVTVPIRRAKPTATCQSDGGRSMSSAAGTSEAKRLLYPTYLDVPMLIDFVASLDDGVSFSSEVAEKIDRGRKGCWRGKC